MPLDTQTADFVKYGLERSEEDMLAAENHYYSA